MRTAIILFIGALTMSQIWSFMVIAEYRTGNISPARYEFYKVGKNISECPTMRTAQEASYAN